MKDLLHFLESVGSLKRVPRTGWIEIGIEDAESVAEHSFRTAIISMILADLQGYDTERTVKMALIHDLAEIEIGDLTPTQKNELGQTYFGKINRAMEIILSKLPLPLKKEYIAIWNEFIENESPMAKIVAQADKLEMVLQALEYEKRGMENQKLDRFWQINLEDNLLQELLISMKSQRKSLPKS